MSIMRPPVEASHLINAVLSCDEPDENHKPAVSDVHNEMDELPQGVLTLLAQLQPMHEPVLKLSLGTPSSALATVTLGLETLEHNTRSTLVNKPVTKLAPALADRQLALQASRLLAEARSHLAVNISITKGMTALASTPAPAPVSPVSPGSPAPLVPGVLIAQVVGPFIAKADADVPVKQETPQSLPVQPLPLMDRHVLAPAVKEPATITKPASVPVPKPEADVGKSSSHYLQVPFSKGEAAGLITVTKAGPERPDQLLLNPSNPLILGHLSDGLAQVTVPRWHLTDRQGHEHSGGHDHGRSDDDTEEGRGKAFQHRHEQGNQDA